MGVEILSIGIGVDALFQLLGVDVLFQLLWLLMFYVSVDKGVLHLHLHGSCSHHSA